MRMKGINLHEIAPLPSAQPSSVVNGPPRHHDESVLPAIIQNEAVSISPVVLQPAVSCDTSEMGHVTKRQKTGDSTSSASPSAAVSLYELHSSLCSMQYAAPALCKPCLCCFIS